MMMTNKKRIIYAYHTFQEVIIVFGTYIGMAPYMVGHPYLLGKISNVFPDFPLSFLTNFC